MTWASQRSPGKLSRCQEKKVHASLQDTCFQHGLSPQRLSRQFRLSVDWTEFHNSQINNNNNKLVKTTLSKINDYYYCTISDTKMVQKLNCITLNYDTVSGSSIIKNYSALHQLFLLLICTYFYIQICHREILRFSLSANMFNILGRRMR